jgi:hypothetical protein
MSTEALKLRRRAWAAVAGLIVPVVVVGMLNSRCSAATFQTRNFSVTADQQDLAEEIGQRAELLRRQLAIFWLGQPLPNWSKPCKLRVREGAIGAGGQTTFQFADGEVLNWDMFVQGSRERILDSVLPHEINHTIFACHFRRPLPRWADEGAATLFEHRSEQLKQLALLNDVIDNSQERFSLRKLMSMKEYPRGMRPMLILYAQGYALADFLVQQKGRRAYLQFISDGEKMGWEEAIRKNFDHDGIDSLERNWQGWVLAGMPKLTVPRDQMMAEAPDESDPQQQPLYASSDRSANGDRNPNDDRGANVDAEAFNSSKLPKNTILRSQSPESTRGSVAVSREENAEGPVARRSRSATIKAPAVSPSASGQGQDSADQPAFTAERNRQQRPSVDEKVRFSFFAEDDSFDVSTDQIESTPQFPDSAEPTGALRSADQVNAHESENDFSQVINVTPRLPGERSVLSGGTPTWAGFPGQQKLF